MNETQFEEFLREQARELNSPPETPRDAIWQSIVAKRAADELAQRRRRRLLVGGGWGIGIAALLILGIGLGRLSMRSAGPGPTVAERSATAEGTAFRMVTDQHLSQAEALLTMVKSSAGSEEINRQTVLWARDLLSSTRLLLDSAAADDARLRILLEDLELVLAEIARLPVDSDEEPQPRAREELDLVRESIENGSVLPRIRTSLPAGNPSAAS